MKKIRVSTKNCTKRVDITLNLNPFLTFFVFNLNIGKKHETFSRKLFALLTDKLFHQGGIKSDFSCTSTTAESRAKIW